MDLNYKVNPDEVESSFDAVPAGEYIAIIENSDYVPNKKGTGNYLGLTYQIIEGNFKGRKIFENLNLENQNQQAEQIARKSLNSIGLATGITDIKDSSQLHNIPMLIDVGIKDDPNYGLQNRIKKHSALPGSMAQQPQTQQSGMFPNNANPEAKKHSWE
jgi:hypothetical protein